MNTDKGILVAYRLEWKPGDYCFLTPENYARELCKNSARTWGLYTEPQSKCPDTAVVYKGSYWIEPKYIKNRCLDEFKPLYMGPLLYEPSFDEDVLYLFPSFLPSMVEDKLQKSYPHLYTDQNK